MGWIWLLRLLFMNDYTWNGRMGNIVEERGVAEALPIVPIVKHLGQKGLLFGVSDAPQHGFFSKEALCAAPKRATYSLCYVLLAQNKIEMGKRFGEVSLMMSLDSVPYLCPGVAGLPLLTVGFQILLNDKMKDAVNVNDPNFRRLKDMFIVGKIVKNKYIGFGIQDNLNDLAFIVHKNLGYEGNRLIIQVLQISTLVLISGAICNVYIKFLEYLYRSFINLKLDVIEDVVVNDDIEVKDISNFAFINCCIYKIKRDLYESIEESEIYGGYYGY